MRPLLRALAHPLTWLAASLALNLARDRRGLSTICSATRPWVPPAAAVGGWALLTAWFLPHYVRPQLAARRLAAAEPRETSGNFPETVYAGHMGR